mmetsp:Transcript_8063/g.12331  ORF Transcript_8063/g.12331 Transcript_8063/m.12331 type:complete len:125 (+) Transcript_8063:132-506(+)
MSSKLLKQYGTVGVVAYGSVTMVCMTSIYLSLRSFGPEPILYPLETCFGTDSKVLQTVRAKLQDAPPPLTIEAAAEGTTSNINWVREATYFGVAGAIDSLFLPVKLVAVVPLARYLLKLRGRRH